MSEINFKLKTKDNYKNGASVIFSSTKEDFDKYFDIIADEILNIQKCSIYYLEDQSVEISQEDLETYYSNFNNVNLFVFPISSNTLLTHNRAIDTDFDYAVKHNIPIIPIIVEEHQFEFFNSKFDKMQAIDRSKDYDSYKEKLKASIEAKLLNDKTTKKIKDAFDAYIFLSYRKKDRIHAQEIMSLIHEDEFLRDVAIWYDENLEAGRSFEQQIKDILKKSQLFTLVVTPNINEKVDGEDNYVKANEYPAALNSSKEILPIEAIDTDKKDFKDNYPEVSDLLISKNNKEELFNRINEILKDTVIAKKNHENESNHLFLMGLAYLNAVDVERNVDKATELFEKAIEVATKAEDKLPPYETLIDIYENGKYTNVNYTKAIEYVKAYHNVFTINQKGYWNTYDSLLNLLVDNGRYVECLELAKSIYEEAKEHIGETKKKTIEYLDWFGLLYRALDAESAFKTIKECYEISRNSYGDDDSDTLNYLENLALAYSDRIFGKHKAHKLMQQCYNIKLKKFGEDDDATIEALSTLAYTYLGIHRKKKAYELYQRRYDLLVNKYGHKSEQTFNALKELADIYVIRKDRFNAIEKYELLYNLEKELYGEKHPYTISTLHDIGDAYTEFHIYNKAKDTYRRCYELRKEVLGEKHPDTITSYFESENSERNDAITEKDIEEAKTALRGMEESFGEGHKLIKYYKSIISIKKSAKKLQEYDPTIYIDEKTNKKHLNKPVTILFIVIGILAVIGVIVGFIWVNEYEQRPIKQEVNAKENAKVVTYSGTYMYPTLGVQAECAVELTSDVSRGDIVLFKIGEGTVFARVIGMPGEHVEYRYCEEDAKLHFYINDKKYSETYKVEEWALLTPESEKGYKYNDVVLNEDEYYLVYDNRTMIPDSRTNGPIKKEDIIGKVFSYEILQQEK